MAFLDIPILHCFLGTQRQLKQAVDVGFQLALNIKR